MVEDLCGFFHVGCSLEQLEDFKDVHDIWWISEWKYSSTANNKVHNIITDLADELGEDCTDEEYDELRQLYQDTIIKVLQDLREAGRLKNSQGDEIIYIIQYADASDEEFEDVSFAQINPEKYIPLFENRFKAKSGENLYDFLLEKYSALK